MNLEQEIKNNIGLNSSQVQPEPITPHPEPQPQPVTIFDVGRLLNESDPPKQK